MTTEKKITWTRGPKYRLFLSGTEHEVTEYVREKTGKMIPCPGEAHGNAYIDNCGLCAPRWGEIEEVAPVDLEAAHKGGFVVPCGDLSDEVLKATLKDPRWKLEHVHKINRKGSLCSSYGVFVPVPDAPTGPLLADVEKS